MDRRAPSGFYDLTLTAEAFDADISPISILDMRPLLVANGGLLVWEGFQRSSFSGRYLRDQLQARGFEVTYGFGEFPGGMTGFDGVFVAAAGSDCAYVQDGTVGTGRLGEAAQQLLQDRCVASP